jgi:hypothetical protein
MRRRLAVAGLAVLACTTFATAACATKPSTPTTPTTPAKAPVDVLNDAVAKTKGQSFKYTLKYGTNFTGDGAQDAAGTSATSNVSYVDAATGLGIKAKVVRVGDSLYVKLDLGGLTAAVPGLATLGDKWLSLDKKRIGTSGLASGITPGGDSNTAEAYLKGVTKAERVSDTEIKGTIDLSKSAPSLVPATEIAKLSADTKVVPFTATLDDQGRIAKIVISMPKVSTFPAQDLTTTFTDYGSTVTVTKPADADTVAAPDMIYTFLA